MNAHYLVIDQGGHSTRALVYDSTGNRILFAQANVAATNPQPGWYEQVARDVQESLQQCLQSLAQQLARQPVQICAAALVTQRSSLLACYKDSLQPITPVISWQDTRNSDWLAQQAQTLDLATLKQLTGLRLNAHYGASKMRWLLDHNPQVAAAARNHNLLFLPVAAWIAHILTGSRTLAVDAATAARTFLCEFGQQQWSTTLLHTFGIAADMLPPVTPSRYTYGDIAIGNQRIPLQVVGGDQSFLVFAYGAEALAHSLFINAGTGAFVQTTLALAETPSQLLCSVAALDNHHAVTVAEGTVNACASALDWLGDQEGVTLTTSQVDTALIHVAAPPVFHHRITALGSPYWLPAGESSFTENTPLPEKIVAVVESIVFLLAINIGLLHAAKPALRQVYVSGGISQSDGFCRKLANIVQLPVIRCRDHEASARGVLFYLAGTRHYPAIDDAAVFTPAADAALHTRYRQFSDWLSAELA